MAGSLLVFDLDGTLIDSADSISSAVNRARESLGLQKAERSFLHQRIGLPADCLFEDLDLTKEQLLYTIKIFRERLLVGLEEGIILFPGTLDFLRAAKNNNCFTAIATNKPATFAKELVARSDLNEIIDLVVGIGEFPPKPNPAMLLYCSEHFNTSNTTMFGDRVEDMQAAKFAGAHALGVLQSVHDEEELLRSGADQVFPNFFSIHRHFELNVWRI